MSVHEARLEGVQGALEALSIDALLITNLINAQYLTGFTGTNGQVVVGPRGAVFMSDPRYAARAGALVQGAEVQIYPSRLSETLGPLVREQGFRRIGFESKTMTVAERDELASRLDDVQLVATSGVIEDLRRRKSPAEVELIRAAIGVGDQTFDWIVERLAPGQTEREVALQLELKMRELGAEAVSFPPIVGSGPLSAHIHHTPTDRELQKGDLVLLDFGCRLDGYCSDLTRTVVLGPATEEQTVWYDLVLTAQRAGIEGVGPGRGGSEVDADARRVIAAAGRAEAFGHGLGHGVGLEIHEAPRLNRISEETLVPGDVVTVEPGVYLEDTGGIRVEDCVLVIDGGREVLGSAPKDRLIEL